MKKITLLLLILKALLLASDIEVVFHIKGMTCPTCTRAVKLSLLGVSGVKSAKVYLNDEKAIVIMDESVHINLLQEAVKKVGYTAEQIK